MGLMALKVSQGWPFIRVGMSNFPGAHVFNHCRDFPLGLEENKSSLLCKFLHNYKYFLARRRRPVICFKSLSAFMVAATLHFYQVLVTLSKS